MYYSIDLIFIKSTLFQSYLKNHDQIKTVIMNENRDLTLNINVTKVNLFQ